MGEPCWCGVSHDGPVLFGKCQFFSTLLFEYRALVADVVFSCTWRVEVRCSSTCTRATHSFNVYIQFVYLCIVRCINVLFHTQVQYFGFAGVKLHAVFAAQVHCNLGSFGQNLSAVPE